MFNFSTKTQVNKKFKMTELYKVMGADKTIKADAANIISVMLTNVLNKDTLNFSVKGNIKEIYLFEIVLKNKTVPLLFISALDKATNFHTVFVLQSGNEEMLYGAFKEYGEKGMKVSKYYSTDWAEKKQISFPLGVNCLDDIYTAIIDELIPIAARTAESTKEFVERYGEVVKMKKEIEKLQRLVDNEKQPKRRFELNDLLRQKKKELEKLI